LYNWIPVLNQFDSLLNTAIKLLTHDLIKSPEKTDINQLVVANEIEIQTHYDLTISILHFTTLLLNNSSNKDIYNSVDVRFNLFLYSS
jgi:hypothetical protein